MPNVAKFRRNANTIKWPVVAGTAFDVGDLLWYDTTNSTVKKASDFVWDTDEETTARQFNARFVGVSDSKFTGNELHDHEIVVPTACTSLMTIVSTDKAFVGALVGPVDNATPDDLQDDTLQIVEDPRDALGYIVKDYSGLTVTEVECVLFSPYDAVNGGIGNRIKKLVIPYGDDWSGTGDILTDYTFNEYVQVVGMEAIVTTLTNGATVISAEKGSTELSTGTLTVPDATAVGGFARAAITDTDGDNYFEPDDTFSVLVKSAATAGAGQITVLYLPIPELG